MATFNPDDYLWVPMRPWPPAKVQAFEAVWQTVLASVPGTWLNYTSPYPKHEFLCYLAEHQAVLMHGSNNPEITLFEPRLQTDYLGRPIRAVFATADGIWPMFFAIIKRQGYKGSLRNACFRAADNTGAPCKFYRFSISQKALAGSPWQPGTIYLLPRASFTPVKDEAGEGLEEWTSPIAIAPLARLAVSPDDFPFLQQVQGHADPLAEVLDDLFTTYQSLNELEEGYALRYPATPEHERKLQAALGLLQEAAPQITTTYEAHAEALWLKFTGPPELKEFIRAAIAEQSKT